MIQKFGTERIDIINQLLQQPIIWKVCLLLPNMTTHTYIYRLIEREFGQFHKDT